MEASPTTGKSRFPWFWVAAASLLLSVVLAAVLVQGRNRNHLKAARDSDAAIIGGPDLAAFTNSLPKQGGPAGYVSSTECKECHSKQYDTWWRSYHRQMTQAMTTNTVQAQF